jgi:hypothetical protein
MKRRKMFSSLITLSAVMTLMGLGLWGYEAPVQAADPVEPTEPNVSPGCVAVPEDVLDALADAPDEHFHKAHAAFLKKEFKVAAEEIRKGTAFLKLEMARAKGDTRKAVTDSIHEMETLASDVERGTVTSVGTLEQAFARAHHALAQHHYARAMEDQAKEARVRMGHALKSAATHLEQGLSWTGKKLEAGTKETCKLAGLVSGKLIQGTGYATEEVGKAMGKVGDEIGQFGRHLVPGKSNSKTGHP